MTPILYDAGQEREAQRTRRIEAVKATRQLMLDFTCAHAPRRRHIYRRKGDAAYHGSQYVYEPTFIPTLRRRCIAKADGGLVNPWTADGPQNLVSVEDQDVPGVSGERPPGVAPPACWADKLGGS